MNSRDQFGSLKAPGAAKRAAGFPAQGRLWLGQAERATGP